MMADLAEIIARQGNPLYDFMAAGTQKAKLLSDEQARKAAQEEAKLEYNLRIQMEQRRMATEERKAQEEKAAADAKLAKLKFQAAEGFYKHAFDGYLATGGQMTPEFLKALNDGTVAEYGLDPGEALPIDPARMQLIKIMGDAELAKRAEKARVQAEKEKRDEARAARQEQATNMSIALQSERLKQLKERGAAGGGMTPKAVKAVSEIGDVFNRLAWDIGHKPLYVKDPEGNPVKNETIAWAFDENDNYDPQLVIEHAMAKRPDLFAKFGAQEKAAWYDFMRSNAPRPATPPMQEITRPEMDLTGGGSLPQAGGEEIRVVPEGAAEFLKTDIDKRTGKKINIWRTVDGKVIADEVD